MEKQLFTWQEWDILGEMTFLYFKCELTKNIQMYKKGDKFSSILVNYENGTISFYPTESEEEHTTYNLELNVTEKVED